MHELVRVTKKFVLDMAHALYGYDGPCRNIHGHTYHLSVTVSGYPLADITHPKNGMVIDFKELKSVIHSRIIEIFDHALVLHESAPYATGSDLGQHFEKVIHTPFQPTCELLLLHFKNQIAGYFDGPVRLVHLRLEETPGSYAEWWSSDNMNAKSPE